MKETIKYEDCDQSYSKISDILQELQEQLERVEVVLKQPFEPYQLLIESVEKAIVSKLFI